MKQKVSVIIPTYKSASSLPRAIESVLNQTYPNIEIIVVDDNDPDSSYRKQTSDLLAPYLEKNSNLFYILHEKNKNGSAARNTGIKHSSGEFISFLDDDDEYEKNRIEICVKELNSQQEYNAIYTNVKMFRDGRNTINFKVKNRGFAWKELMLDDGMLGSGSNIFIRRSVVDDIGFFDESFSRKQDVEFMVRVLFKHRILPVDKFLLIKHLDNKNVPNYVKMHDICLHFFETFNDKIELLNENERKAFFSNQYFLLLKYALNEKNKEHIKSAAKDLSKIRKLRVSEKIYIKFPGVFILSRKIYHNLCKFIGVFS